jgi:predicted RNase H-like HicB family nuclease
MERPFAATVWREGTWYVSQCLDLDLASQGETGEEAFANLREALELHFEPPQATRPPGQRSMAYYGPDANEGARGDSFA